MYRNRIVEHIIIDSQELRRNPLNHRRHPDSQRNALRSLLSTVGVVDELLAYRDPEHGLTLVDGEARWSEGGAWPVAVLDLTPDEALTVLAMLDKIGADAEIDPAALLALLDRLPSQARQTAGQAWSDDELAGIIDGALKPQAPEDVPTEDIPDDDGVGIDDLLAPFPWFGGKARIAGRVWARFGQVDCYVEPFCGSAAVLLACPYDIPTRTINDRDGYVANFWRAVATDPEQVARYADWPVNESDLFARHVWLIKQNGDLIRSLETDPEYYDARIAGWWVWGCCAWIGGGWCNGDGPWNVEGDHVINIRGDAGRGVNRKLPHLGDAGRGVNRQLPYLGNEGQGECAIWTAHIQNYMQRSSDKLRRVRVACGDWSRVTTESVTIRHGITAVLLDPPYGEGAQDYSSGGNADRSIADAVWAWACANGDDPQYRIGVCGYEDGRDVPAGWTAMRWTARKGYQATDEATENPSREVIWFSPHCLRPDAST